LTEQDPTTAFDYEEPKFHVATRSKITARLLPGTFVADRKAWESDPHFLGWPTHLQRLHGAISAASARLVSGLEATLDEPEGSAQERKYLTNMARVGQDLVAHVRGHHGFEDGHVLPGFLAQFPELSVAIDLLEKDHRVLDSALDQTEQLLPSLRREGIDRRSVGRVLVQAKVLGKILSRHTYDEEDILIPAVLHAHA